jgi:hypothetical protein
VLSAFSEQGVSLASARDIVGKQRPRRRRRRLRDFYTAELGTYRPRRQRASGLYFGLPRRAQSAETAGRSSASAAGIFELGRAAVRQSARAVMLRISNNLAVSIVARDNSTRLQRVSTLRQSAGSRTRRLRWSNRYTKSDLILASSGEEDSL